MSGIRKFTTALSNIIKKIDFKLTSNHHKPRGRWGFVGDIGEDKCSKIEERIVRNANEDHCGDLICGIPKKNDSK